MMLVWTLVPILGTSPATAAPLPVPTVGSIDPAIAQFESELVCPSESACLATVSRWDKVSGLTNDHTLARSVDSLSDWKLVTLPRTLGAKSEITVFEVDCLSAQFCYALGNEYKPEGSRVAMVWTTTDPTLSAWTARPQQSTYEMSLQSMDCVTTSFCVAERCERPNESDACIGEVVWSSDQGATWTPTKGLTVPGYRIDHVECPSLVFCFVQSWNGDDEFFVTTTDPVNGPWTSVALPSQSFGAETGGLAQCESSGRCIIGGDSAQVFGDGVQHYYGYWYTDDALTGDWSWKPLSGASYQFPRAGCFGAVCLINGRSILGATADPANGAARVDLTLPKQYGLDLNGMHCFSASACIAWGRDRGAATAGPLMNYKSWFGSPAGGTWSVTDFKNSPQYAKDHAGAHAVACRASGCVAVGGFHIDNWLSLDGWGEVLSIGVAVWASDAQGNWSLAAAKPLPQLGDNGGGAKKKVKTKVTAAATRKGKRATKITGMVSATNGCKASRKVRLLGKGDRVVATTQTKPNGSYSFALNANRHKNLRAKAAIRVTKREKATVVCQAANSQQVRVRWK